MIDTEISQEEERREAHLSPSPSGEPSIGRVIVDAFRGRGGDPQEGPLGRAILYLAIPMVLEMAMESIFAVVDIFFVSRLGPGAMATVGLTITMGCPG